MKFNYTAANAADKRVKGTINAASRQEAIALLREQGLLPLGLEDTSEDAPSSIWQMELTHKDYHKIKLKKKKLLLMMNQMGIMMKAGVSLSMAMEVLIEGERDRTMRTILKELKDDLYTGTPISASMRKFRTFPEILVNIVQSGEANGRLDTAFDRCSLILEKEIALTGKIKGAMGYPVFLLCLTVVMVIVMVAFVVPTFAVMFNQFGADLPDITKAVVAFSDFIINRWYILLVGIGGFVTVFTLLKRKCPPFALKLHQFILIIPFVGVLLKQSYIARFCRIMSSLVEAGVSIVSALEIARDVIPNLYMKQQLSLMIEDVKIGSAINQAMLKYPSFDPLLISMIKVGEESGMLHETMSKMADLYEQQTEESTKKFTTALEPAMTIIVALVVGFIAISIVVPMFGIYTVIK